MNSCNPELTDAQLGATALCQRPFIRCTVAACQTVKHPDGICTPRSVRNLASDLADIFGDTLQT
jgi:hypothetical protein